MMRIFIADDHTLVRRGLIQILQKEYPQAQIEECADAEALIQRIWKEPWDLIITDISMPGRSGLDAIRQIKTQFPRLPVMVLSAHPEDQYALRVLKAGASGYLTKSAPAEELIKAIRYILQGKKYVTPAVTQWLVQGISDDRDENKPAHELLTDREFEVFKLIANGKSLVQISNQLALGATTISTYRARILQKMNLSSNAACTRYAIEHQLI